MLSVGPFAFSFPRLKCWLWVAEMSAIGAMRAMAGAVESEESTSLSSPPSASSKETEPDEGKTSSIDTNDLDSEKTTEGPPSPEARAPSLPVPAGSTDDGNAENGNKDGGDDSASDAVAFTESEADVVIDATSGEFLSQGFDLPQDENDVNDDGDNDFNLAQNFQFDIADLDGHGDEGGGFSDQFSALGLEPNSQIDELQTVSTVQDALDTLADRNKICAPQAGTHSGETMTTLVDRLDTLINVVCESELNGKAAGTFSVGASIERESAATSDLESLPSALRLVVEFLPNLRSILDEKPTLRLQPRSADVDSPGQKMGNNGAIGCSEDIADSFEMGHTTYAGKPRCGLIRVKTASIVTQMAGLRHPAVDALIAQHEFLPRLVDLFFEFELNSTLHFAVGSLLAICLDGNSEILLRQVVQDCALPKRIVEGFRDNEAFVAKSGRRLGFMGVLTSLAGKLQEAAEDNKTPVVEALSEMGEAWSSFFDATIIPLHELHQRPLGGALPQLISQDPHEDLLQQVQSILGNLRSPGGGSPLVSGSDIAQLLAAAMSGGAGGAFGLSMDDCSEGGICRVLSWSDDQLRSLHPWGFYTIRGL